MESTSHPVVAACTEMREGPRQNFTIDDAISQAEWLRRTPDGVLNPDIAKQTIDTLFSAIQRNRPLYNALKNREEIFVLVQHDRCAPAAIASWAARADEHGCSGEKVNEAFATAQRWGKQLPESTRWPD